MSTISSIPGSGLTLQQLLAQAAQQRQLQQSGQNINSSQSTSDQSVTETQTHHHHHGGGGFKKIEDAVTNALQSASGSSDPNQVIQDAIASVLQNNSSSAAPSATTSQNTSTQVSGTAQNSGVNNREAFTQLLQEHGITEDQFSQDFLTAIQDIQNGQSSTSSTLQSLLPGTLINTTA